MALEALAGQGFEIPAVSRLYRTPSFPEGAGPDYVNAAAILVSDAKPGVILDALHSVEAAFGRTRERRWGNRGLDLDLLASGNSILPDRATYDEWRTLPLEQQMEQAPDTLVLPHPRLHERGFVLVPLAEIAPNWRHPVLGKTVSEMLGDLGAADLAGIEPL